MKEHRLRMGTNLYAVGGQFAPVLMTQLDGIYIKSGQSGRSGHHMITLVLPGGIGVAYELLRLCEGISGNMRDIRDYLFVTPSGGRVVKTAKNNAEHLAGRLYKLLGLTPPRTCPAEEDAFLGAIRESPSGLATWCALADWLSEQADHQSQRRGEVMRGWLAG